MIAKLPKSLITSFRDFFKDEGVYLSAALSFFSVLSIIPLLMFTVNVLISLTNEDRIARFVYNKLVYFLPSIEIQIVGEIKKLLMMKGIGEISIVLYGLFSLQLFTALEFSLNKIFKISERRSLLTSFFMAFFLVLLIIVVVGLSFGISYFIRQATLSFFTKLTPFTAFLLKYVITYILLFTLVALFYKLLPKRKIRTSSILIGAFVTAVLIEIAKYLFSYYVSEVIRINTLYGSVSTFLALLMWLFYAWAVFLFGAELVNNLEKSR